ncbi:hypothetical protein NDU88_005965 [Pleurodeles waltl]|uniref:Uncharacterized protein n=1 Tax=Pleurodeles waltl TaxID=8319 RepID=A0AAV7W993_PLEWA|nr:hypothetical protein NDU88_005965 [Pleurodeles waltl]
MQSERALQAKLAAIAMGEKKLLQEETQLALDERNDNLGLIPNEDGGGNGEVPTWGPHTLRLPKGIVHSFVVGMTLRLRRVVKKNVGA